MGRRRKTRTPNNPGLWYALPRALYSGGNHAQLLSGGDELFPAMQAAIARAVHEVWLATYIFHDDEAGLGIAASLVAAAARGARVRVVVDGFGSQAALAHLQRLFDGTGVALAVYRPVTGWRAILQPEQLRRMHQKLCVVDGDTAFVGGINVLDDRFDLHHGRLDAPRLDFAVALRGHVVVPIEQTARGLWTRAAFGRDWREEALAVARSTAPITQLRSLLRRMRIKPAALAVLPGLADPRPVRAAFVVRDNLSQRRAIERSFIDALRHAHRRFDLVTPYFYPGGQFRRALRDAARRGVQVRVLLQGRFDYRIAGIAARALYDELVSHGVRIYEYEPAFLHAKVAVADDDWATVGSSNIDPLSLLLNLEGNVLLRDEAFATRLGAQIERAIAASREVTPRSVPHGAWARLQGGFVAWCARAYLRVAGITGRY